MSVLVYRALSNHNVLTRMSVAMAEALSGQGAAAQVLAFDPAGQASWVQAIAEALSGGGVDHVLSFGSFGAELRTADGRSFYDAAGCGFIGWDVDHPAYQFARFTSPIRRRVQVCASSSHVEFARMMGCEATPCVMLPGADAVAVDPLPLAERPVAVTVAMNWLGEPVTWWSGAKGTPVFALIETMVGRLLADPDADILAAYLAGCADAGLELTLNADVCNLIANVGRFVRQYDRWRLAQALAAAGVPCTIHGSGWRERLGERPHLTFADDLDFSQTGEAYARSRIVLNLNAANGAGERAISAMAVGAAVISDPSPLMRSEFADRGALRFLDRCDFGTLADTLDAALNDPGLQDTADNGRLRVAEAHLWPHKAARLLQVLAGPI